MTKLRIAGKVNDSITDGPGLRYTVFVQGCPHNCKGCHNPQTHDFAGGKEVDIKQLLDEGLQNPLLCGVTFSGGEPTLQGEFLLELLENEKRTSMGEISQDIRHNFIRAEAYIDAHLGDRISNRRLAGICGISISYFIRQFREIYRMSPQEYIMARRLRKSRFLLLQTSRSIDQIAESLGFCNTSHFIRRFRKTEGMTPARYRKTYGEAAGQ